MNIKFKDGEDGYKPIINNFESKISGVKTKSTSELTES